MTNSFVDAAFLGTAMPVPLTWPDAGIRLVCALIAAAIIGYNRGESGKAAGMRTTILVCLAAAIAMLQMNFLLTLAGRPGDSFIMNDLMRLPLGILTGVGFIGGGAILRRGNLVIGVTTAATLWYVTVIGLCFGGGQVSLGWTATGFGFFVLWGLKWLEDLMPVRQQARLAVTVDAAGPTEAEICRRLAAHGIAVNDVGLEMDGPRRTYTINVRESRPLADSVIPPVVDDLSRYPGVASLKWRYFE